MANTITEHRLVDTNKRTLAKYILVSDGTQYANSVLLDVSTLKFALNANGYIMASNTHPKSTTDKASLTLPVSLNVSLIALLGVKNFF